MLLKSNCSNVGRHVILFNSICFVRLASLHLLLNRYLEYRGNADSVLSQYTQQVFVQGFFLTEVGGLRKLTSFSQDLRSYSEE